MFFKRNQSAKESLQIGKTIFDELSESVICRTLNDPKEGISDLWNFDRVWINPEYQFSFKSGWYTKQDLRDWLNGTGIIVKGKTTAIKKKYTDYALFILSNKDEDHPLWEIIHTYKWFNQFDTNFKLDIRGQGIYGINLRIKIPLKNKSIKTVDPDENRKREEYIIINVFSHYINDIVESLEYKKWNDIKKEYDNIFYGVKKTLYCFGYGYFGASNTPEDISNLSYITNIIYSKALYIHYKKIGKSLPDFKWLSNRNF